MIKSNITLGCISVHRSAKNIGVNPHIRISDGTSCCVSVSSRFKKEGIILSSPHPLRSLAPSQGLMDKTIFFFQFQNTRIQVQKGYIGYSVLKSLMDNEGKSVEENERIICLDLVQNHLLFVTSKRKLV